MVAWLLVITLAYLFFALSAFGDKLVLSGIPNPISYTFYSGLLSILAVILIPFVGLSFPGLNLFLWIILDAIIFVFALYFGFSAVEHFEVSKVAVTIGATQPIFIFFISWFFWGIQLMSFSNFFAFLLLLIGSVFIAFDKKPELTRQYLKFTLLSSLLYSFDYVLLKYIFTNFSFIQGMIWRSILLFVVVLFFLVRKKNRKEIFKKKIKNKKKLEKTFIATQACGGIANILQGFAISLAPVALLPVVNSMRGLQYVFLFVITFFVSYFFPKILKEKISTPILIRKIISIVIIILGLVFLVF